LDAKVVSSRDAQMNIKNNLLPDHSEAMNAIFNFDAGRKKNLKVHVNDVYNGLVRAGYYSDAKEPTMFQMMQRVKTMSKKGMIVYADHTSIVLSITPIIIDLEDEFSDFEDEFTSLNIKANDSLALDMPPLEDALDEDGLIINDVPPSDDEELILDVTQPYAYMNDKAVPWCYDAEIDVVTQSGRTYAQANSQPVKPVTDEEAKEFLAVVATRSRRPRKVQGEKLELRGILIMRVS